MRPPPSARTAYAAAADASLPPTATNHVTLSTYRRRSACVVSSAQRHSLHLLRSPDRVHGKMAVLMYKALHGSAPTYPSRLVRVADLPGRSSLSPLMHAPVVCKTRPSDCLPSVAGPSQSMDQPFGIIFQTTRLQLRPSLPNFRQRLKISSFPISFPDFILDNL